MDKNEIIADLESIKQILVSLNAEEVDDPEDYLISLGGREDWIKTLEATIEIVSKS